MPPDDVRYVITVADGCLDEAQAAALAAGTLPPAARGALDAHVVTCESCRQVLAEAKRGAPHAATLAASTAPGPGTPPPSPASRDAWAIGQHVGRYVVRGRIGRGGMGAVYRADDVELGRPVALKRLHATADAETRARLIREARAAAKLAHPHVVTVYEVGDADGTPYLAMELVDGTTLTAWLADATRTWREIVAMFAQAGRGLTAAHEHGLVHRDFKPDNVLVDRAGRARVADFGLARAGDERDAQSSTPASRDASLARLTATGSLAGTPAYLAPEVVAGGSPDARSDQYAFAVALFEALHGHHPFAGKTADTLWAEMAAGRIRSGGRPVPAWLERHVRRGLEVDPAARWPDVARFVGAIDRADRRRRRWPIIAAAAVVVATASSIVAVRSRSTHDTCDRADAPMAALWPARRAAVVAAFGASTAAATTTVAALDQFAAEWRTAATTACRAHTSGTQSIELTDRRAACLDRARIRVDAVLAEITSGAPRALAGAPAAAESLPDLAPCADLVQLAHADALPTSRKDRAELDAAERQLADAQAARDRGDLDAADRLVDAVIGTAKRLDTSGLHARADLVGVQVASDRGDGDRALTTAFKAMNEASMEGQSDLVIAAQLAFVSANARIDAKGIDDLVAIAKDLPETRTAAHLYAQLGTAQEHAGHYADATASFERAQQIREKLLPRDHIDHLIGEYELAGVLVMQHHEAAALPALERIHAAFELRAAPLRREAIEALHALAMAELATGHADRAVVHERDVLARRVQVFGEHGGITATARDHLATALDASGDRAGSVAMRTIAIADELELEGAQSLNAAQARVNLAVDDIGLARYDDAIALLALARPVLVAAVGDQHPNVAIADLAAAHAIVARDGATKTTAGLDDASAALDRAAAIFTTTFGAKSSPMAAVTEIRGLTEAARGHWDAADRAFVAALALVGDTAGEDRADIELDHARAQWALGQRDAAHASADAAVHDYEAAGPGFVDRVAAARAWLAAPSR